MPRKIACGNALQGPRNNEVKVDETTDDCSKYGVASNNHMDGGLLHENRERQRDSLASKKDG